MKALVMDIESVVDAALACRSEKVESLDDYIQDLKERTGRDDPFVPYIYHRPVALVAILLWSDGSGEMHTEPYIYQDRIARQWWDLWSRMTRKAGEPVRVVTWNGRGYDLPVLEACALSEFLSVPEWFKGPTAKVWENPRANASGVHVDLMDWFRNYGGAPKTSLNSAAAAIGIPGKLGTSGGDVAEMHAAGQFDEIAAYCATDVLTTLGVFLRYLLVLGHAVDEDAILVGACEQLKSRGPEVLNNAVSGWAAERSSMA